MDQYLATLLTFGSEHAFRQLGFDMSLNWRGLSHSGRDKALAALVGFASC